MVFEAKKRIRKSILETRDALDLNKKEEWDSKVFVNLVNSDFYQNAVMIFSFVSFGSEVDTHRIIKYALKNKKKICVPKIASKERGIEVFRIHGLEDFKVGYFNILEPVEGSERVLTEDIDLILMPGLAFGRDGGRIGYGAGFYDRFLTSMNKKVQRIALAYHFQVFDTVPTNESDVNIDGIITNEEIITNDSIGTGGVQLFERFSK